MDKEALEHIHFSLRCYGETMSRAELADKMKDLIEAIAPICPECSNVECGCQFKKTGRHYNEVEE